MKSINLKKYWKKILLLPFLTFCLAFVSGKENIVLAKGLESGDFSPNVFFDPDSYARGQGFGYINGNRELWNDESQEERYEYYLFDTRKSREVVVSTIDAYHEEGKDELTLGVGASLLTESETQRTFGLDSSIKTGIVIVKIGCGWKWGEANSKTISSNGYATIGLNNPTGYYYRTAICTIREYFLVTRKITRTVNKDKKGRVIGYSNYYGSYGENTGKFENFDYVDGVDYSTDRR